QKENVVFILSRRDISIVDPSGTRRVVPGKIEVWIGGGQPLAMSTGAKPAGVAAQLTITSEATLPD
ncbi:MAG: hypothetical protein WBE10_08295, partial [Candidatus Acidiferrum sp.]